MPMNLADVAHSLEVHIRIELMHATSMAALILLIPLTKSPKFTRNAAALAVPLLYKKNKINSHIFRHLLLKF